MTIEFCVFGALYVFWLGLMAYAFSVLSCDRT